MWMPGSISRKHPTQGRYDCPRQAVHFGPHVHDGRASGVLDGLQTLLDSHLITLKAEPADQPRFAMLETIHELRAAIAAAQFNLGLLLLIQGELAEAESIFWTSYEPWEQQQHPRYIGAALITLGYIAALRGEPQQASAMLRDGLRQLMLAQETTYLLYGLLALAQAHIAQARAQSALEAFERTLQRGRALAGQSGRAGAVADRKGGFLSFLIMRTCIPRPRG